MGLFSIGQIPALHFVHFTDISEEELSRNAQLEFAFLP